MKPLFFMITSCCILISFEMFAQNSENLEVECSDNQAEDESCIRRFKRFDNYENSVIVDPIERESLNMRPSSKESSFYEQMTR